MNIQKQDHGRTLTGFIKKDNKEAKTYNINNCETLEEYLKISGKTVQYEIILEYIAN